MKKIMFIAIAMVALTIGSMSAYAKEIPSQKVMDFIMSKSPAGTNMKLLKEIPIGDSGFSFMLFDFSSAGQQRQLTFVSDGVYLTNSLVEMESGKNITEYYETISKTLKVPVSPDEVHFGDPAKAKVEIVIFSDFECPYCQTLSMSLQPVFEQYKGDIVAYYKHYPLPFHKNAMLLAKIYEAGKKLGYHFDMYGKDINGKNYEQIMKLFDVGVKPEDMGKFYTELNNPAITDKITRNVEEAKQVGVQGTPFLLVNGHPVSGNRPELIKELIETEMSK